MPRPTKKDQAKIKVLHDGGMSFNATGNATGFDPKTCQSVLARTDFNTPEMKDLIDKLKAREESELRLIGGKARAILDQYLNSVLRGDKSPNPVAIVCIQDRSFQQRRLLEGQSTENIGVKGLMDVLNRDLKELTKQREALLNQMEETEDK
jgi:hypothetical protein